MLNSIVTKRNTYKQYKWRFKIDIYTNVRQDDILNHVLLYVLMLLWTYFIALYRCYRMLHGGTRIQVGSAFSARRTYLRCACSPRLVETSTPLIVGVGGWMGASSLPWRESNGLATIARPSVLGVDCVCHPETPPGKLGIWGSEYRERAAMPVRGRMYTGAHTRVIYTRHEQTSRHRAVCDWGLQTASNAS